MLNDIFLLFVEFFKTGLFTFGGGYASIPFLYEIARNYDWFSESQLTQMIAISGLTPGPVGLNMATFSGFQAQGIIGSIIASFALCFPMIVITSFVFKLYKEFSNNDYVKSILNFLRPASCALITGVGLKLFYNLIYETKDLNGFVLFFILFLCTFKLPRNPVYYMIIAALWGIVSLSVTT